MEIVLILAIAALIGAVLWALSGRREQWLIGEPEDRRRWGPRPVEDGAHGPGEAPADSFAYGRPGRSRRQGRHAASTERIPIRTRLLGLVGLIVLVAFGALALAVALWQAGHFVNQTISKFLGK